MTSRFLYAELEARGGYREVGHRCQVCGGRAGQRFGRGLRLRCLNCGNNREVAPLLEVSLRDYVLRAGRWIARQYRRCAGRKGMRPRQSLATYQMSMGCL